MPDIYNKEYRKNRLRLFRRNLFYGTRYKSIVMAQRGYKTNSKTRTCIFHFHLCPSRYAILRGNILLFFLAPPFATIIKQKNYEKMRKPRRKRLTSTELCAIIFNGIGKTRLFFVLWLAVANLLCRPDGFRNTSGRIKGKTTGKITAKKKKSRDRT